MAHGGVVAELSIGAERREVRQAFEVLEPVGGDARDVPEQIELEDAVETREAGESLIREGPIDEQGHRPVAVGLRVGR